ncbi:MAG: CvpA family protein [Deltaproteobacteria bacterium]
MINLPSIITRVNWVDIFAVILAIRIVYIAFRNGLKVEFFKLLGTLTALYVSLHYYTSLSAFLNQRIFSRQDPSSTLNAFSFLLLFCAGYGVFFLLRVLIGRVVKSEVHANLDKWGGLAVGACRALLTVSLFLCFFISTDKPYFRKSIFGSFLGPDAVTFAPDTYACFWNTVASKLQRNEKMNPAVSEMRGASEKK